MSTRFSTYVLGSRMVLLSRSTSSFATNLSSLSPSVSCRPSSFSHGYTLRILALVSEAWNLLYGPWDLKRPTFPAVLQSVPARSLTDVAVAVLPPNALGQTRVCSTVIFHFPQLSTTLPFWAKICSWLTNNGAPQVRDLSICHNEWFPDAFILGGGPADGHA